MTKQNDSDYDGSRDWPIGSRFRSADFEQRKTDKHYNRSNYNRTDIFPQLSYQLELTNRDFNQCSKYDCSCDILHAEVPGFSECDYSEKRREKTERDSLNDRESASYRNLQECGNAGAEHYGTYENDYFGRGHIHRGTEQERDADRGAEHSEDVLQSENRPFAYRRFIFYSVNDTFSQLCHFYSKGEFSV